MLRLLKLQDIGQPKVRLGPSTPGDCGDGGYIAPANILEKSVALFTYGVADDIKYETEYVQKYNKPAYLFDHTVDHPSQPAPSLFFKKEGLGKGLPDCKDFIEHYIELDLRGDVLLKIDIEGSEFDYFNNANIPYIAACTTGLILEIHQLQEESNRDKFVTMMNKLLEYYVLNHVHGNNWGGTFYYIESVNASKFTGYVVPKVLELTFANKRYVTNIIPDNQIYPIAGLDLPNNPGTPDCSLDFLNE